MPHISVVREQRSSMANIHYVPEVNILDTLHPDTKMNIIMTSFPDFGVKLSCVCLMIAYRKKMPKVTQR